MQTVSGLKNRSGNGMENILEEAGSVITAIIFLTAVISAFTKIIISLAV